MTKTKCPYDGRTAEGRLWQIGHRDACDGLTPRNMMSAYYMKGHAAGVKDRQKGMSDAE